MNTQLILGQVLTFSGDPFARPVDDVAGLERRGAIALAAGRILATGPADVLRAAYPDATIRDMGDAVLLPGFVDAHMHYPQTGIIASWGKRLIDWLNTYTFPEEMRFGDPDYARTQADLTLDSGTGAGNNHIGQLLHHPPGQCGCVVWRGRSARHGGGGRQDLHGSQRARRAARHGRDRL